MKKFIKISLLVLFIIFVFGITTSKAYTVGEETKAAKMLEELRKENGEITGIWDKVREKNEHLYCEQPGVYTWQQARYKLQKKEPTTYPDADNQNGYAKAYILAAPGYPEYIKSDDDWQNMTMDDERQWAWYVVNKFISLEGNANDLYKIAMKYQEYRKLENQLIEKNGNAVTLTEGPDAKTFSRGENTVYGPIRIEYLYTKVSSGSHFDEWGGFNYAFFDESDNSISDKVKLCILSENDEYTEITSTPISSSEYYKVSTAEYNTEDLYIVTNDKTITKINIKIQSNSKNYKANVYQLKADKVVLANGDIDYCEDCKKKNNYINYLGNLYIYKGSITQVKKNNIAPNAYNTYNGTKSYTGKKATIGRWS